MTATRRRPDRATAFGHPPPGASVPVGGTGEVAPIVLDPEARRAAGVLVPSRASARVPAAVYRADPIDRGRIPEPAETPAPAAEFHRTTNTTQEANHA